MKTKTVSYLVMLGLITQFIVIASVSAAPISFLGTDDINMGSEPSMMQVADMSALSHTTGTYPVVDGFWTDLVNTEKVSQTGENVYVAVLDTGLLPFYPALFPHANIRADLGIGFSHDITWDDTANDIAIGPLRSDRGFITDLASGHGTHVTSTIVGFDLGGVGVAGVAPDVNIIPVLVLDAWAVDSPYGTLTFNGGTDPMVAAGLYYIGDLAETLDGPVVINMSLGGGYSTMIEDAVDYAISKGVVVVASAGNEDYAGMGYPGGLDQIISVASVGWTGTFVTGWSSDAPEDLNTADAFGNNHQLYLSDFSSRPNKDLGQKAQHLDVAAPGQWIVGPYRSAFADNFGFYYLSGTSMASPHVAGMAALLLQAYPDLTHGEVEFIIKRAAAGNPLPSDGSWDFYPFVPGGLVYFHSWGGGEYGSGFLTADQLLTAGALHA